MRHSIVRQRVGLVACLVFATIGYGAATYPGRDEAEVLGSVVTNVEHVGERHTPDHQVLLRLADGTEVVATVAPSAGFPFRPGTTLDVTPRRGLLDGRTYFVKAPPRER